MQFINVRLLVRDFPKAYAFWRDVMGLTVKYGPDMAGMPPDYAYFQVGEVGIELMPRASMAAALGEVRAADTATTDRRMALVFKVEDVDAAYADVVARGATSVTTPHDRPAWGARTAHIGDPDGHLIEIYSPLSAPDAPSD